MFLKNDKVTVELEDTIGTPFGVIFEVIGKINRKRMFQDDGPDTIGVVFNCKWNNVNWRASGSQEWADQFEIGDILYVQELP